MPDTPSKPKGARKKAKRRANKDPLKKLSNRRKKPQERNQSRPRGTKGLNQKQLAFVEAYVQSGNALQSALTAGYSPASAGVKGHQLLKHTNVIEAIARRQESLAREMELKGTMTKEWILTRLKEIAGVDMGDIATWQGMNVDLKDSSTLTPSVRRTIQSLSSGKNGPSVKSADKIRALDLASSILGFKSDKLDVTSQGQAITFVLPVNGHEQMPEGQVPQPEDDDNMDED